MLVAAWSSRLGRERVLLEAAMDTAGEDGVARNSSRSFDSITSPASRAVHEAAVRSAPGHFVPQRALRQAEREVSSATRSDRSARASGDEPTSRRFVATL